MQSRLWQRVKIPRRNRRRWVFSLRHLLVIGIAVCLLLGGFVLYRHMTAAGGDTEAEEETRPEQQGRSYRFYTMLPRAEVDVPSTPGPLRTQEIDTPRWLQAGAFCRDEQAQRRLREIAALDLAGKMVVSEGETSSGRNPCPPPATEGGQTRRYRVYVGPFHNWAKLGETRRKLRREGIDTLERRAIPE